MYLDILRKSALPIVLRGFGVIAAFLLNIVIANTLGADEVGLFYQVISVVLIFSAFSRLGIDVYVLREFSYRSKSYSCNKKSVYKKSVVLIFVASLILFIVLYMSSSLLAKSWFHDDRLIKLFVISSLIIPFYSFLMFYSELMKAIERAALSIFFQFVSLSVILLVFVYFFPQEISVDDLLFFYLLAVVISLLIVYPIWNRGSVIVYETINKTSISYIDILNNSKHFFLIYILTIVINNIDSVILGNLISSQEVGVYMIAFKIAVTLSIVQVGFNSYLSPKFVQETGERLNRLFYFSTTLMAILGLLLSFAVVGYSREILLLFGAEFTVADNLLIYLVLIQFVHLATGSAGLMMMLRGYEKYVVNIIFVSLLMKVGLGYLLVESYGVIGIAYAGLLVSIFQNIYFFYFVRKKILE